MRGAKPAKPLRRAEPLYETCRNLVRHQAPLWALVPDFSAVGAAIPQPSPAGWVNRFHVPEPRRGAIAPRLNPTRSVRRDPVLIRSDPVPIRCRSHRRH